MALKEEDHGRMFPVSNSARSVAEAMIQRMEKLGVKIYMQTAVKQVDYEDGHVKGVTLKDGQEISASAVIVAVGGKSVPRTGSTGDGYAWAKKQDIPSQNFIRQKCQLRLVSLLLNKKCYKERRFVMCPFLF